VSSPETQKKRPNPFYPAFDLLLAKLLAAEQSLRVSEAAFERVAELPGEGMAQAPEEELPGMMADICNSSIPGYVRYIPSFRWPEREEDYLLRAVRDFRTQSCLWSIARAFEHFREFVEAVVEILPKPETACPCQLQALVTRLVPRRREQADRTFNGMLKRIRGAAPALVACEKTNARSIPLRQWIQVAAQVRHAVAHNEGILAPETYERYRSSGLEKHFPGELEADVGYVLKPIAETTTKAIRTFREYGVAIYKTVSEAHGFQATLLGPKGELTTWRR